MVLQLCFCISEQKEISFQCNTAPMGFFKSKGGTVDEKSCS